MLLANMRKVYRTSNDRLYSCQFHVVIVTKFCRKGFKNGVEVRAKELMGELAEKYGAKLVDISVFPDTIHMVLDTDPEIGIGELVRLMKKESALILKKEFPELATRMPTFWSKKVFISTVGDVDMEDVNDFINAQKGKWVNRKYIINHD